MKKEEQHVHQAVCRYVQYQYPGVIFFSEPSGLRVTPGLARLLKSLRSETKLPDLFIAEPKGDKSGLFIEIKASYEDLYLKNGDIRKMEHLQMQKKMLERLQSKGYTAVFGAGFDACKIIIDEYLSKKNPITPELLEKIVCRHYRIEKELLHCKSQKREITEPRQLVMSLIYTLIDTSNQTSGLFYRKDHATVTHARKQMQDLCDSNKLFQEKITRILHDLGLKDITFYKN